MIATDDDGRLDFAAPDQVVHGHAKLGAFAEPEPANTSGQSLEMDSLFRELHPAGERFVLWKHVEREAVGARDVFGIAAKRNPSEWTAPFAEKRPDVFRHETGDIERVLDAGLFRLGPNVVPVVESDRAFVLQ